MATSRTILIIGAGFSGVVTAVRLLRQPGPLPLRVVLLNRSGPSARGLAYGTRSSVHLLNVPAGRMSAFDESPDDFFHFARQLVPGATPASFLPRRVYGAYLDALLAAAAGAAPNATLERWVGEAVSLSGGEAADQARVTTADGTTVAADRVVLALGNYAPRDPAADGEAFYASERYIRDPWAPGALDRVAPGSRVVLIGTGLTMADVALDLRGRGAGLMSACSRRGLLPRPHQPSATAPAPAHRPPGLGSLPTARAYLHAVREQVRAMAAQGVGWRVVLDALRPVTPQLWQALPLGERSRLLRHARPYWEVHRHRMAPSAFEDLRQMIDGGQLRPRAARVRRYEWDSEGVTVWVQPRGRADLEPLRAEAVINCTGPAEDVRRIGDPLLQFLLASGQVRAGPLGLGLDVAPSGALIGANGGPSSVLHYVGPLLREQYWESTAVPELRGHATRLAAELVRSLGDSGSG